MAYGKWRWDYGTGELQYLEGNTPIRNTTLAELTNNFEATTGGTIYRPGTGGALYSQGFGGLGTPENPAPLVELFDNGQVVVTTGLARAPASLQTSEDAQYGIRGTINYLLSTGQSKSLQIGFSTILARGYRGLAYTDDAGITRIAQVRPGSPQERALLELYGGTIRDATPAELMETALAGYLQKNAMDVVDELAGVEAGDDPNTKRTKRSGTIRLLAQQWSPNLTYAKQHYVYQQLSE